MMQFLQQLALLTQANVPLLLAIETLESSSTKKHWRNLLRHIKFELEAGKSLAECFAVNHRYFDRICYHLTRIGEETGNLKSVLDKIAEYQATQLERHRRLTQALLYPCLVLVSAALIFLILLTVVIPHFSELFVHNRVKLPFPTRLIFSISDAISDWVYFILLLAILLGCFIYYEKTAFFKFCIRLPIIQAFQYQVFLAKFSYALSILLLNQLPMQKSLLLALEASSPTTQQMVIIQTINESLNSGFGLYDAMRATQFFPPLILQLIKVGEETAKLPQLLQRVADILETQIHQRLQQLATLLEPLIILFLGVVIGGLVISIYLPIFNLGNSF